MDFRPGIEGLRVSQAEADRLTRAAKPTKPSGFIKVPKVWVKRLEGASGMTYQVVLRMLYLHWRHKGRPFRLPTGTWITGASKWRGLRNLEKRGLIRVETHPRKAPLISIMDQG
jgi:hypothetical protein